MTASHKQDEHACSEGGGAYAYLKQVILNETGIDLSADADDANIQEAIARLGRLDDVRKDQCLSEFLNWTIADHEREADGSNNSASAGTTAGVILSELVRAVCSATERVEKLVGRAVIHTDATTYFHKTIIRRMGVKRDYWQPSSSRGLYSRQLKELNLDAPVPDEFATLLRQLEERERLNVLQELAAISFSVSADQLAGTKEALTQMIELTRRVEVLGNHVEQLSQFFVTQQENQPKFKYRIAFDRPKDEQPADGWMHFPVDDG